MQLLEDNTVIRSKKWAEMIDWSNADWSKANTIQQNFEESRLFPIVLSDMKKDASLTPDHSVSFKSLQTLIDANINQSYNPNIIDDDLELINSNDKIGPIEVSCKTEAKAKNYSLQGDRDKDDDHDSVVIRINQLRNEVQPGTSILSLLTTKSQCNCDYNTYNASSLVAY
jgi:hypothetical protein